MPMFLRTLVLAGAAVVALAAPARAQAGFVVEYPEVQDPDAVRGREYLMGTRQVDRLAQWLNAWIRMPRQVPLRYVECTSSDVRWNPEERAVEVCYRMVTRIYGVAGAEDSLRMAAGGTHLYVTLHGVAHAIIDELNLATPDGEEAAVDELSALLIGHMYEPGVAAFILGGVTTLQRADPRWGEWAYATAHGLTAERFRRLACLVDGIHPSGDPGLRRVGLVDAGARQRCRTAALRVVDVWGRRLGRYLR